MTRVFSREVERLGDALAFGTASPRDVPKPLAPDVRAYLRDMEWDLVEVRILGTAREWNECKRFLPEVRRAIRQLT